MHVDKLSIILPLPPPPPHTHARLLSPPPTLSLPLSPFQPSLPSFYLYSKAKLPQNTTISMVWVSMYTISYIPTTSLGLEVTKVIVLPSPPFYQLHASLSVLHTFLDRIFHSPHRVASCPGSLVMVIIRSHGSNVIPEPLPSICAIGLRCCNNNVQVGKGYRKKLTCNIVSRLVFEIHTQIHDRLK